MLQSLLMVEGRELKKKGDWPFSRKQIAGHYTGLSYLFPDKAIP